LETLVPARPPRPSHSSRVFGGADLVNECLLRISVSGKYLSTDLRLHLCISQLCAAGTALTLIRQVRRTEAQGQSNSPKVVQGAS